MPFFPGMQIAGLALLVAVLITMGLDKDVWRISWIVGVPWLMLVSAGYFIWKARLGAAAKQSRSIKGQMASPGGEHR
jgi:L-asparagine transporter-like permease